MNSAQLAPDVLLGNGTPATVALKQATTTIPIVFSVVNDPVSARVVSRAWLIPAATSPAFPFSNIR